MSNENWTGGTWQVERTGEGAFDVVSYNNEWEICNLSRSDDRVLEDAHLIAAAPELYEALKDAMRFARKDFSSQEDFEDAYSEQVAALNKARGE